MRKLLHKDGTEAKVGDTVTSFRGETATITGWAKNGHNRVYVKWPSETGVSAGGEYFPSVFNLTWEAEQ